MSAASLWLFDSPILGNVLTAAALILLPVFASVVLRRNFPRRSLVLSAIVFVGVALLLSYAYLQAGPWQTEMMAVPWAIVYVVLSKAQRRFSVLTTLVAALCLLIVTGLKEPFLFSCAAAAIILAPSLRSFLNIFVLPCCIAAITGLAMLTVLGLLDGYVSVYIPLLFAARAGGGALWVRGLVPMFILKSIFEQVWILPVVFVLWGLGAIGVFQKKATRLLTKIAYLFTAIFLLLSVLEPDAEVHSPDVFLFAGACAVLIAAVFSLRRRIKRKRSDSAWWSPRVPVFVAGALGCLPYGIFVLFALNITRRPPLAPMIVLLFLPCAAFLIASGRERAQRHLLRSLALLLFASFTLIVHAGAYIAFTSPFVALLPYVAAAFLLLLLYTNGQEEPDGYRQILRSFIVGFSLYLVTFAVASPGDFQAQHFVLIIPFALALLLKAIDSVALKALSASRLQLPLLLTTVIAWMFVSFQAYAHATLVSEITIREEQLPRLVAARIDQVLDRCPGKSYFVASGLVFPVNGYTVHSPTNFLVYPPLYAVRRFGPMAVEITEKRLQNTDLVVLSTASIEGGRLPRFDHLRPDEFTADPWDCAGTLLHGFPDYQFFFRK